MPDHPTPPPGSGRGDDLGLGRLAPEVDVAAGAAAFGRARAAARRRRRTMGASAGVLVLVALVGITVAVVRSPADHVTDVRAGAPTSTAPTKLTAPAGRPVTATATDHGVRLRLSIPSDRVVVGQRFVVHVTVTNVGSQDVHWQAGGCGLPTSAVLRAANGSDTVTLPALTQDLWDGRVPALGTWLHRADHRPFEGTAGAPPRSDPNQGVACTDEYREKALGPGHSLEQDIALQARVGLGSLSSLQPFQVVDEFTDITGGPPSTPSPTPTPTVTVRAALRLVDDPRRAGTAGSAISDLASSTIVRNWVESERPVQPAAPGTKQTYSTQLTWWRGAWELWIAPRFGSGRADRLRVRWSPAEHRIVDIRAVAMGQTPEDEPGATTPSPGSADRVLYHRP